MLSDPRWYIVRQAAEFLGEMGGEEEYRKILLWLPSETNAAVRSEMCSALLNLQKFASQ